MSEFIHLDPNAIMLLGESIELKIDAVNENFFVPHPIATELLSAMRWRMALPPGPRRPSIVLGGSSGLGKSHITLEFMRQCGIDPRTGLDTRGEKSIFLMDCTGIRSAKLFRDRFWRLVGSNPGKSDDIYDGCLLIKRSKTRFVILEEAHTLRHVKGDLGLVTDYVKLICNVCERPIMLLGDVNVDDVIQSDSHLMSRFKHWRLSPWDDVKKLRDFVNSIIARIPLPEPSPITDDETLSIVIAETTGITEFIVLSLRATAVRVLEQRGTKITREEWLKTLRGPY